MTHPNRSTPSEYAQGNRPTRRNIPFLGVPADSKLDAFNRIEFSSALDPAPASYRKPLRYVKQLLDHADAENKRLRGE